MAVTGHRDAARLMLQGGSRTERRIGAADDQGGRSLRRSQNVQFWLKLQSGHHPHRGIKVRPYAGSMWHIVQEAILIEINGDSQRLL